jgi:hypothetical protein
MERATVEGIIGIDDFQKYVESHGFDAAETATLVQLTSNALADKKTKDAAKAAAEAKAAAKQISLADLERAVRLGLTTLENYNGALTGAGFDAVSIALLDGILKTQIATDKATAAKRAAALAAKTVKGPTLGQLEAEVINGITPMADYTAALRQLGYTTDDAADLTALLQLKVDQAAATAAKRATAAAELAARGISLTQAERAVKLGLVPVAVYRAMLATAGYTPDAVDVLANTLTAEMAATMQAQAKAKAAAAALLKRKISLPQIETAVLDGIKEIGVYYDTLIGAGYSTDDANTLTTLLQLKLDQHDAAVKAHADAIGLATQKGISLGDEEKAVLAGTRTMSDYDSLLAALGYDDVDRATLEALLQAKIDAAAAKAEAKAAKDAAAAPPDSTAPPEPPASTP